MVNLHVEVTTVPKSETYLDPSSSATITSPNYTGNYPNNAYCLWEYVTKAGYVFEIAFQRFDIETDSDSFFFGDGVEQFVNDGMSCSSWDSIKNNQQSTTVTSKSSSIKFIFTTGSSGTRPGFQIKLVPMSAKSVTHNADIVKHHFLNISSGIPVTVSSHQNTTGISYPAHCSWLAWTFETRAGYRIQIEFLQFDFEDGQEFFVFGDGTVLKEASRLARFTGKDRPSVVTSVSNASWIGIKYDYDQCCHNPVFEVNVKVVTIIPSVIDIDKMIGHPTHSEITAVNNTNQYQLWDLQAPDGSVLFVEIIKLDIDPSTDFIYLGDGGDNFSEQDERCSSWMRLTQDNARSSITSRNSSMTLLFSSTSFGSGRGFSLKFNFKSFERNCTKSVGNYSFKKNRNVTLSTDNITRTINSNRCIRYYWTFDVTHGANIRISFHNFALQNDGIFLLIGDGVSLKMSTTLANFSGDDKPSDVITVSNSAWLMIHDSNDRWCETSSMDLSLTVTEYHGENIFVNETFRYLLSFPFFNKASYANNNYSIWDVRTTGSYTIEARVTKIDTESGKDFIYIGDGAEPFDMESASWHCLSGNLRDSKIFKSNTSSMRIIFTSNGITTRSGFFIELNAVRGEMSSTKQPRAGTGSVDVGQDDTPSDLAGILSNTSYLMYILVGASGVVSLILLSICLRWVHVKLHRRRVAMLEENNYYEEAPTLPALPPRNKQPLKQEHTLDDNTYESVREYRNTPSDKNDFKYGSKDSDLNSTIAPEINSYTLVPDPLSLSFISQKADGIHSASDASDEEFVIIDQGERTSYIHTQVQIKNDEEDSKACVTKASDSECLDDVPSPTGSGLNDLSSDLIHRKGSRRDQFERPRANDERKETGNDGNFIYFKNVLPDLKPVLIEGNYLHEEKHNPISSALIKTSEAFDESGYMVPNPLDTDENLGSPISTMLGQSNKKSSLKSRPPKVAKKMKKQSSMDTRDNITHRCLGWKEIKARPHYLKPKVPTEDVDIDLLQHTYMGSEDLEPNNHVTRQDGDPELHGDIMKSFQVSKVDKGGSGSPDGSLQHIYHEHGSLFPTQEDDMPSYSAEGAVAHEDQINARDLDGFGYLVLEDSRV